MDMNRLRYFQVLTQAGSMREASELIGISQPALSKAIKTLEEEIGFELTIPSGRGISITDKGTQFIKLAEKSIDEFQKLQDALHGESNIANVIRIGSFEVFTTHFLGALIEKYLSEFKVDVYELTPGKMEEGLVDGVIDIGITYLPIPNPKIDFLKITKFKMSIFGRKDIFKNHSFNELPFVVPITPISGSPTKVKGLDGWPDNQLPKKYHLSSLYDGISIRALSSWFSGCLFSANGC